jgi:D-alanyl-D-alanine carboxypeptidase
VTILVEALRWRRHHRLALLGALAVVTAACTSAGGGITTVAPAADAPSTTHAPLTTTSEPAPSTSVAAGRSGELQSFVEDWSVANDPVGVAAAVLFPDGELWLGAAGLADRETALAVAPTDRFEIASITKTFMATLTLRLVEEAVIDLDDPIAGFLPDFPAADEITVRMLLGHRAGIFDPTPILVTDQFGPPDPNKVFTPEELLTATAAETPTYPPGSRHEYTNAGYWVLAAVLETATGTDTASLLDAYVTGPMGLADTLLFDASLPEVEVVNAYKDLDLDGDEDPMGTAPLPGLVTPAWTAGGMISTAADLVTFLDGLFAGNLLTEASLDEMTDTANGGGTYAMGIYQSSGRWGHDGGIAGYLSAVFHDTGTGVTVAVLTNRFGPDAPQADALAPRLAAVANQLADS